MYSHPGFSMTGTASRFLVGIPRCLARCVEQGCREAVVLVVEGIWTHGTMDPGHSTWLCCCFVDSSSVVSNDVAETDFKIGECGCKRFNAPYIP